MDSTYLDCVLKGIVPIGNLRLHNRAIGVGVRMVAIVIDLLDQELFRYMKVSCTANRRVYSNKLRESWSYSVLNRRIEGKRLTSNEDLDLLLEASGVCELLFALPSSLG
jgi:hypothetical protein